MSRSFTSNLWDFDGDGEAFIVAQDKYTAAEAVEKADLELPDHKGMQARYGMCAYQCRSDWEDDEGGPKGGYIVEIGEARKGRRGWFPVWIVR